MAQEKSNPPAGSPSTSTAKTPGTTGGYAGSTSSVTGNTPTGDRLTGKWHQLKGSVKQEFSKLTDDDLAYIDGAQEKFVGRLQERYGIAREEAEKRYRAFIDQYGRAA